MVMAGGIAHRECQFDEWIQPLYLQASEVIAGFKAETINARGGRSAGWQQRFATAVAIRFTAAQQLPFVVRALPLEPDFYPCHWAAERSVENVCRDTHQEFSSL